MIVAFLLWSALIAVGPDSGRGTQKGHPVDSGIVGLWLIG